MFSCTISVHKSQYKLSIKAIRGVVHMEAMQAGCYCDVTEQCYLLFVVGRRNADCGSIRGGWKQHPEVLCYIACTRFMVRSHRLTQLDYERLAHSHPIMYVEELYSLEEIIMVLGKGFHHICTQCRLQQHHAKQHKPT